jgi:hypothetical protein
MPFIVDDICVVFGVIVVWLAKGCKHSLKEEINGIEVGDFWRRREGILGLATFGAIGGLYYVVCTFLFG